MAATAPHGAGLRAWLTDLVDAHGWDFLFAIFCFHHVLKGFVLTYVYLSFDFVMRVYHIPGPRMQLLRMMTMMPWALKPVLGIVSDAFPIGGLRKSPYLLLSSVSGFAAFATAGILGTDGMSLQAMVIAFAVMNLQIATCDLLTEAAVAERVRRFPHLGPALMSFVAGGITVGEIIAAGSVGAVLEALGPCGPCAICVLPSFAMLLPVFANAFGEVPEDIYHTHSRRESFLGQPEMLFLTLATGLASLTLVMAGSAEVATTVKFKIVLAVSLSIVAAFTSLLNPVIGMLIAFFFLQSISTISLDGGTFYFFTDDLNSFPPGPHFTVWFYTTGCSLVASICGLLGLVFYNRYLLGWRYRSIFVLSNTLWSTVAIVSILIYTRRNLELGIPDQVFVMGGAVLQNVFERWAYVPGGIMLSQVCPVGMEATMFALLAGCLNLGRAVASCFGAFILMELGVNPKGVIGDEHEFTFLWKAAVLQALAPVLTLLLIPTLLPDASQTDRLIGDSHSEATDGSPWSVLRARLRKRFRGSFPGDQEHLGGTGFGGCRYGAVEGSTGSTGFSDCEIGS